eukprot:CAMPEP_0113665906 /NCGR_PEP_ID=MMETSP0038_2-20120614/2562_1 /TAXON_ID=2898 /ORGANISM="Cryptomonas paramecium" /LENGTH=163 /DNA_ID=CAMNT_0000581305 /DNA_START=201 /DNA_END=689 /DNA_ORIENTATION=+ /assembly_acc=CAM_ASM_000170
MPSSGDNRSRDRASEQQDIESSQSSFDYIVISWKTSPESHPARSQVGNQDSFEILLTSLEAHVVARHSRALFLPLAAVQQVFRPNAPADVLVREHRGRRLAPLWRVHPAGQQLARLLVRGRVAHPPVHADAARGPRRVLHAVGPPPAAPLLLLLRAVGRPGRQ